MKTVSPKQLAANRANAARSTGPRTPEGKARSSRNASTHGLASVAFHVLRIEEPDLFDRLKAQAAEVYQPVNAEEMFAVERIALAKLGILRVARLEAGLFTRALHTAVSADMLRPEFTVAGEAHLEQSRNYIVADGFWRHTLDRGNVWTVFLRYQAQAERQYRRAVEAFDALKARRAPAEDDLPIEPISALQPEENEDSLRRETNPFPSRQTTLGEAAGAPAPGPEPLPPIPPRPLLKLEQPPQKH
jgi:hypothetical protein